MFTYEEIYDQTADAVRELVNIDRPFLRPVSLLVIGCSSSEIAGGTIGHDSTYEYGQAVAHAVIDAAKELNYTPVFQCCEHLNRALVIEQDMAERLGLEIVCAVPRMKAGGSCATAAWKKLMDPVLVEHVRADAGIDIGLTMIGMHLKDVAVPIRLTRTHIGDALITAACTRPRLIGGERARYTERED